MRVGILRGNGIGPEIIRATQRVLDSTGVPIEWEDILIADEAVEKFGHPLPPESVRQLRFVGMTIKAPLIVNKLQGRISCIQDDGSVQTYPSLNNAIRRELDLFVNPRSIVGFPSISGRHEDLDVVIMREVTEDVYIGLEHQIGNDIAAEAVKLTTRAAALRVAKFSFEYARKHGRQRVTCLHKANVLNYTDGLFLRCFEEVSKEYADIRADDMVIDAACYTIVRDPRRFDYGDIFSDLVAGLVGSLGLAPGANLGDGVAVFEACHGAAPDIADKGIANPLALIMSGAQLLDAAGHSKEAKIVLEGIKNVIGAAEDLTPDLGGTGTTDSLTTALVAEVRRLLA
ncbi:isocitrate/isopropylmalate dehydrogenase [Ilyonectria sp. MPI-CAGE-AT-0026]|nr:isocitrate/isopropylmalate dehydrogenase [Ilyonectria sp. MPI-CAGE-AT-0026]